MAKANPGSGGAEPHDEKSASSWTAARSKTTLLIVTGLVVAAGLGVGAFALWGPTSTPATSSTDSPRTPDPGAESPSATSPPPTSTQPPVVPDVTPISIEKPGTIKPGLTATISLVEAVDGVARGPGEVAGPSLRVTVTITNTTAKVVSLQTSVISCYFGADRTPAPELREPGGSPLPDSVAAGKAVGGVYVFTVPMDERKNVTIMVDYSVDEDPLVFQGDVATLMNR